MAELVGELAPKIELMLLGGGSVNGVSEQRAAGKELEEPSSQTNRAQLFASSGDLGSIEVICRRWQTDTLWDAGEGKEKVETGIGPDRHSGGEILCFPPLNEVG